MKDNSGFEIAASDTVQSIAPPSDSEKFEGIAFSPSGNTLAVAAATTNTVFLYRRKSDGLFEEEPFSSIDGSRRQHNYPHGVAFSKSGDSELLAVARRSGTIAIHEKLRGGENYCRDPVFEIYGPKTNLNFSDGVAFVPPDNDYLAACNLQIGSISFYRISSRSPIRFELLPVFELKSAGLSNPDGLAFSECGKWLAVANHGDHSVAIFQRRNKILSAGKLRYGRNPVMVVKDSGLRHPHSVAFTPETNHLVVTNAGANYFSVYEPMPRNYKMRWSPSPVLEKSVGLESLFIEVNGRNKMEGGPKGIAIHKNSIAVCNPEYGVKIYSFRERSFLP
jgi:DNA-binding beta-propeller fold protein YncE